MAGGGGVGASTNGQYSISGTIGQHDASGTLTGTNLTLVGGFWSYQTIQMPGAPLLGVTSTNGMVMVYWPSPSPGFSLQVSSNLDNVQWTASSQSVSDNGTIKYILFTPDPGKKYFRLKYP